MLATDHPLLKKTQIRLNDVEPLPFVLLGEAHCLSAHIEAFCHQRSFHPVSVERTSQLATVQELVSLKHGISFVPAMARVLDDSDRRAYRSITGPKPTRKITMIWNPYRFQSCLLQKFKAPVRG